MRKTEKNRNRTATPKDKNVSRKFLAMEDSDNPEDNTYFQCKNHFRCGNMWSSDDLLCSKCRNEDVVIGLESIITPSQSASQDDVISQSASQNDSSTRRGYFFNNIVSFVYQYGTKVGKFFHCSVINCKSKKAFNNGNTTNFKGHLERDHKIFDPARVVKAKSDPFASFKKSKVEKDEASVSFDLSYLHMIAKQYLPFSMLDEKHVQNCFIAFAKEHCKTGIKFQSNFINNVGLLIKKSSASSAHGVK
jgi:hypothetical protein